MFYFTALNYAQTLWLQGFPAKALLLVNRSFSCCLTSVSLLPSARGVAPYHAKAWIIQHRPADGFIGNPRRHYQHLATRMVEPHKTLRTWRAWACWYLAKELLPETHFPGDAKQVRDEGVVKPTRAVIAEQLAKHSPGDDLAAWEDALALCHSWLAKHPHPPQPALTFRSIGPEEIPVVRHLAGEIWHGAYPGIITVEQIHYMLERMYAPEELRQEMVVRGVKYALIEADGAPCGYMAWEFVPQERLMALHKLYLRPSLHGCGAGAAALRWLEEEARQEHCTAIRLRVNRHNHRAIRAYLRAGFTFGPDLCSDIGGGFVMDDHVMEKQLRDEVQDSRL